MKKTSLFFLFFLFSSLIHLNHSFVVDQECLKQCAGINASCMSKCLNPHPSYQSCKAVCDSNNNLCIKQCDNYYDLQKKIQETDPTKSN